MTTLLLLEIDSSTDYIIGDMLASPYQPESIEGWGFTGPDRDRLTDLFDFLSVAGYGTRNSVQIGDPQLIQSPEHFTPKVEKYFWTNFPKTKEKLQW